MINRNQNAHEAARAVVCADHIAQAIRIVQELRRLPAGGGGDALAEGVVDILRGALGIADAGQLVELVVGVSVGSVENEIPVGVVLLGRAADARVLVQRVGHVSGRDAVDDCARAIAGRIVVVGEVLVRQARDWSR